MRSSIFNYFLASLITIISLTARAQNADVIDGFSIKVSPAVLSFNGDLSFQGFNPFKTLKESSKLGFNLTAMKEFNSKVGVQAQYSAGNLYSINQDENLYFEGSVSEFSVSARITPLGFFDIKNKYNIQPYITLGLGSFGYRSCRRFIDTDDVKPPCYGYESDGITRTPRNNSLAIPLGLGVSVPINKNLSVDLDHVVRITNTDLLDATMGISESNDRYSFTSIGLRFTIKPVEPVNRQRIAGQSRTELNIDKTSKDEELVSNQSVNIFVESLMDDVIPSGEAFSINLRINKGNYTGPAKLVQRFPEGFTALEASSTNGRFSYSNRNVLIEWDNMPADSMVNYTYYVRVDAQIAGSQTITGRIEYEESDKWQTIRFNNYIFVDNNAIFDLNNTDNLTDKIDDAVLKADKKAEEEENRLEEEYNKGVNKVQKEEIDLKANIDPLILKQPKDDIEFRIQCGAFQNSNEGGIKLVERYKITEDVREVYENGWYKYTIGSFKSYVEAVNYKNNFIKRTKLYTAFIVAYKNGKRVPNINDAFR